MNITSSLKSLRNDDSKNIEGVDELITKID